MEKRISWADALRGALILMIVYGHTASNGDTLKHYVYSFHVAAFFFLSGFLFSKGSGGFKAFLRKKFTSLMIPYYIFSVISIVIFSLLGSFASVKLDVAIKHGEVYKNVLGMLYANAVEGYMKWNLPLWFLPCMFVSQLFAYPVFEKTASLVKKNSLNALVVVFSAFILPYLDYFVFRVRALPFHLESAVFLMPFFLLGMCFRQIQLDTSADTLKKRIYCILLLVSGGAIALTMNCRVNYFLSSYGKITVFYASAFLSVIGLYMLVQRINSRLLSFIGQNTLPILLMHKFPVVLFQIILSPVFGKTGPVHTLLSVLITLVSVSMCIFAGKILERFFPFMIGKRKIAIQEENHGKQSCTHSC